jgi:hypothetical protein
MNLLDVKKPVTAETWLLMQTTAGLDFPVCAYLRQGLRGSDKHKNMATILKILASRVLGPADQQS